MHVFLLSIDGQWRWSPPGRVRVDGFPRPALTPEGASVNELTGPELSDLGAGVTYYSTRVDLVPAPG